MPFVSKAQMRGAFSGAFGPEMKSKARTWAHETPDIKSLPQHVVKRKGMQRKAMIGQMRGGM